MTEKITFSIAAPVFNEIEIVEEFYTRVKKVMEDLGDTWELILVDDGSTDGSTEKILQLSKLDARIIPVIFARNFGHQIAITAGIDHAKGDAVIVLDADLQDPPEVIPELIGRWKEGYEVVYAVRAEREGESSFKKITASLFYRLINRITDVKIPLDTGDFRLLDRQAVNAFRTMHERHRFPRGMSAWIGFRQIGVTYKRAARFAGETKYPFKKMFRLALEAVTGFSTFPLQLATYFGFFCVGASVIAILVMIVLRLIGHHPFTVLAVILLAAFFLGGIQLISLGIIGEYLGRIYDETRGRPLYIIREPRESDLRKFRRGEDRST